MSNVEKQGIVNRCVPLEEARGYYYQRVYLGINMAKVHHVKLL